MKPVHPGTLLRLAYMASEIGIVRVLMETMRQATSSTPEEIERMASSERHLACAEELFAELQRQAGISVLVPIPTCDVVAARVAARRDEACSEQALLN